MDRLRVTIGGLVGLIAFIALGFAALRAGSADWDLATFNATLMALTGSILLAIHRTAAARAFWIGFALAGGIYLVAGLVPEVRSRLVTNRALVLLDRLRTAETDEISMSVDPEVKARFLLPDGGTRPEVTLGINPVDGKLYGTLGGTPEFYYPIGHSLWAIVAGLTGGLTSRYLFAVSREAGGGPGRGRSGR